MLVIRKEQMDTFRMVARRAFEDAMAQHLKTFSPLLCKAAGEERLRETIRLGISQAGSYGFTFRGPLRLYLELMLSLGSHFDTDPQYPWAIQILSNQEAPQMQRAEALYEKAVDCFKVIFGPNNIYLRTAVRNVRCTLLQPLPLHQTDILSVISKQIAQVYPQKAIYVSTENLTALLRQGSDRARDHRLLSTRGGVLFIMLTLILGHCCSSDPLYPWIAQTLNNKNIIDSPSRVNTLETHALNWFDHMLA